MVGLITKHSDTDRLDAIQWAHQMTLVGEDSRNRTDSEVTARTDAPNYGFPENSFRQVMPQVIRDKNPAWRWATRLLPVSREAAAGAEEIVYNRVSYTSEWTLMGSGYSNNIGKSDFQSSNIEYKADYFESHFDYSIPDVDRLAQAKRRGDIPSAINLVREKSEAALRGWIQKKNRIFSQGNNSRGLFGIINHPDVLRLSIDNRLSTETDAVTNLATLNTMESTIVDESNGEEYPDMLVLPTTPLYDLNQQIFDGTSTETVLGHFLRKSFTVKDADIAPELKGAGTGGSDLGFMYNRQPEKIQAVIPKEITFLPPQRWGNGFKVFCHGKVSGTHIKYPLSALLLEFPAE